MTCAPIDQAQLRPSSLLSTTTPLTAAELASHRNERARRQRARKALETVKRGGCVDFARAEAARELLLAHHGARGTAKEEMAKGIFFEGKRVPEQDEVQCDFCSKTGDPFWVWAKKKHCCTGRTGGASMWEEPRKKERHDFC